MLKKLKKLAFSRMFIIGLLILMQFFVILVAAIEFTRYFILYYTVAYIVALIFVLLMINSNQRTAYKMAWTVVIFMFPAFGVAIYLIFCGNRLSKRFQNKMSFMSDVTKDTLDDGEDTISEISKISGEVAKQCRYVCNTSKCPPYSETYSKYFKSGEDLIDTLIEKLETAEKYIFLEYFIIGKGEMWDRIYTVLRKKVEEGVDVRVIYDDIGCIFTLERNYSKKLEKDGIKCRAFHKFVPVLVSRQNNRDHRKICVIDGVIGFTGGINIADEYINKASRFGYWKDNAVMLEGDAVWSFTVMFLTMWDYIEGNKNCGDYSRFKPDYLKQNVESTGFVQPYTDNPLDNEPLGENIYIGMIETAKKYLWITTPYLIIDERMMESLFKAVKSGVDVRIVTPGIPDKKIVNETTKAYYPALIENGVKIFEYTPGFIHAKTFLCDGEYASVGSVNLDYRSLYLHFECGVLLYKSPCINDIMADFEEIFSQSERINMPKNNILQKLFRGVLELIAPLL